VLSANASVSVRNITFLVETELLHSVKFLSPASLQQCFCIVLYCNIVLPFSVVTYALLSFVEQLSVGQ